MWACTYWEGAIGPSHLPLVYRTLFNEEAAIQRISEWQEHRSSLPKVNNISGLKGLTLHDSISQEYAVAMDMDREAERVV